MQEKINYTQRFEHEYKRLNAQQKKAVDTIYGSAMVVAGPGTGKTQIIASRTANILAKTDIHPENIFITTFTDAGVLAIRKRLIQFIGNDAYKVNVSTIHSFASEVIKTFPEKFIEYKASASIDDVESLELLKQIIDTLLEQKQIEFLTSDYDPYYYLRTIQSRIFTLKQEGTSEEKLEYAIEKQQADYAEELSEIKPTLKKYEKTKEKQEKHIQKLKELQIFFNAYNTTLREKGLYDFNDMINFVLEKFQTDEDLVYHYAEKFQFIMLDEYQDTNNAQNQIIDLILQAAETQNIMVVGDDDQSIYRFQGANIENMLEFSTHHADTNFIVLEDNYRSIPAVLQSSQQLIEHNSERLSNKIDGINKELIASGAYKGSTNTVKLFKAASDIQEQTFVLNTIKSYLKTGVTPEEIAIIVRGNMEVKSWTQLLLQNGIAADSKLKTNILNSPYVSYILDFIELIHDPFAAESKLIDVMRNDITGLPRIDIFKINRILYRQNYAKKFKTRFIDYLNQLENIPEENLEELELDNISALFAFKNKLIDLQAKSSEVSLSEFISIFIKEFGILEFVETHGDFYDLEDVYTLFNMIKRWVGANKNLTIDQFLRKIELYKEYNYPINRQVLKENDSGVQIMTAHSSKGLEFNTVFIPGLYTGNWDGKKTRDLLKLPVYISGEGIQNTTFEQVEEDRRLFFVALTRAVENLYLSYPAGIGTKPLLESVFLQELNGTFEEIKDPLLEEEGIVTIDKVVENTIKNDLISYDNLDIAYIEDFLQTYKLSPTDLNTFIEDPKLFLNRVVFKYPFEDNKYTIFGKVYHRTLELFYLKYKNEGELPEKSYLTGTFTLLLDKETITTDEYEQMREKGITGLEGYYDLYAAKAETPLVLEYSFRRKNIFFEEIPLTGTIDKIEKSKAATSHSLSEGEGIATGGQIAMFRETVDLIDYKTGKAKTLGVIKGIDRYGNKKEGNGAGNYFRQLLFYKLLCEMDYEFGSKFVVGSLALDFVEGKDGNYKYIEVDCTEEEYEYFKNELRNSWDQITDMDFWREVLQK